LVGPGVKKEGQACKRLEKTPEWRSKRAQGRGENTPKLIFVREGQRDEKAISADVEPGLSLREETWKGVT